ncbi:hypothetical protein FRB91_006421, partial [Serendipita sp. 411]
MTVHSAAVQHDIHNVIPETASTSSVAAEPKPSPLPQEITTTTTKGIVPLSTITSKIQTRTEKATKPIRAAIVGLGIAGAGFHVPLISSLSELFTLLYVVDSSPPSGITPINARTEGEVTRDDEFSYTREFHDRFGESTRYLKDYEQVLKDEEIELVVIATPTATHYDFARSALLAGKHVLLDKPVTVTYDEARRLGELAKEQNRVLYAFQNRRWDSDYLTLLKTLREGTLGPITDFVSHYDRYRNFLKGTWKEKAVPGGGQFYSLGPHLIDQTLHYFGRPSKVTGFIQNIRSMGDPAVDDDFTVILHYAPTSSNPYVLTATLRGHLLSVREPQQRFVVRGSKGTFSKFGFDVQERQMQVDGREAVTKPDFGVEPEDLWATLEIVGEDGKEVTSQRIESLKGDYQELYRNLANVIRYDEEPEVKWQDAELTMLITELALKSSREGRTIEVSRVEEQSLLNDNGREGNEIDVKFCSSRL